MSEQLKVPMSDYADTFLLIRSWEPVSHTRNISVMRWH